MSETRYVIRSEGGQFAVKNMKTNKVLAKRYGSRDAAKRAIVGFHKRNKGVKAYHSCAKQHKCGKQKRKPTKRLTRVDEGGGRISYQRRPYPPKKTPARKPKAKGKSKAKSKGTRKKTPQKKSSSRPNTGEFSHMLNALDEIQLQIV